MPAAETNLMKLNQYSMCLASNIFMWIKIIFVFSFGFWIGALCVDCCSSVRMLCACAWLRIYTHYTVHGLQFYWHRFFSSILPFNPIQSNWIESNAICNENSPWISEAWKNKVNFSSAWFEKRGLCFSYGLVNLPFCSPFVRKSNHLFAHEKNRSE